MRRGREGRQKGRPLRRVSVCCDEGKGLPEWRRSPPPAKPGALACRNGGVFLLSALAVLVFALCLFEALRPVLAVGFVSQSVLQANVFPFFPTRRNSALRRQSPSSAAKRFPCNESQQQVRRAGGCFLTARWRGVRETLPEVCYTQSAAPSTFREWSLQPCLRCLPRLARRESSLKSQSRGSLLDEDGFVGAETSTEEAFFEDAISSPSPRRLSPPPFHRGRRREDPRLAALLGSDGPKEFLETLADLAGRLPLKEWPLAKRIRALQRLAALHVRGQRPSADLETEQKSKAPVPFLLKSPVIHELLDAVEESLGDASAADAVAVLKAAALLKVKVSLSFVGAASAALAGGSCGADGTCFSPSQLLDLWMAADALPPLRTSSSFMRLLLRETSTVLQRAAVGTLAGGAWEADKGGAHADSDSLLLGFAVRVGRIAVRFRPASLTPAFVQALVFFVGRRLGGVSEKGESLKQDSNEKEDQTSDDTFRAAARLLFSLAKIKQRIEDTQQPQLHEEEQEQGRFSDVHPSPAVNLGPNPEVPLKSAILSLFEGGHLAAVLESCASSLQKGSGCVKDLSLLLAATNFLIGSQRTLSASASSSASFPEASAQWKAVEAFAKACCANVLLSLDALESPDSASFLLTHLHVFRKIAEKQGVRDGALWEETTRRLASRASDLWAETKDAQTQDAEKKDAQTKSRESVALAEILGGDVVAEKEVLRDAAALVLELYGLADAASRLRRKNWARRLENPVPSLPPRREDRHSNREMKAALDGASSVEEFLAEIEKRRQALHAPEGQVEEEAVRRMGSRCLVGSLLSLARNCRSPRFVNPPTKGLPLSSNPRRPWLLDQRFLFLLESLELLFRNAETDGGSAASLPLDWTLQTGPQCLWALTQLGVFDSKGALSAASRSSARPLRRLLEVRERLGKFLFSDVKRRAAEGRLGPRDVLCCLRVLYSLSEETSPPEASWSAASALQNSAFVQTFFEGAVRAVPSLDSEQTADAFLLAVKIKGLFSHPHPQPSRQTQEPADLAPAKSCCSSAALFLQSLAERLREVPSTEKKSLFMQKILIACASLTSQLQRARRGAAFPISTKEEEKRLAELEETVARLVQESLALWHGNPGVDQIPASRIPVFVWALAALLSKSHPKDAAADSPLSVVKRSGLLRLLERTLELGASSSANDGLLPYAQHDAPRQQSQRLAALEAFWQLAARMAGGLFSAGQPQREEGQTPADSDEALDACRALFAAQLLRAAKMGQARGEEGTPSAASTQELFVDSSCEGSEELARECTAASLPLGVESRLLTNMLHTEAALFHALSASPADKATAFGDAARAALGKMRLARRAQEARVYRHFASAALAAEGEGSAASAPDGRELVKHALNVLGMARRAEELSVSRGVVFANEKGGAFLEGRAAALGVIAASLRLKCVLPQPLLVALSAEAVQQLQCSADASVNGLEGEEEALARVEAAKAELRNSVESFVARQVSQGISLSAVSALFPLVEALSLHQRILRLLEQFAFGLRSPTEEESGNANSPQARPDSGMATLRDEAADDRRLRALRCWMNSQQRWSHSLSASKAGAVFNAVLSENARSPAVRVEVARAAGEALSLLCFINSKNAAAAKETAENLTRSSGAKIEHAAALSHASSLFLRLLSKPLREALPADHLSSQKVKAAAGEEKLKTHSASWGWEALEHNQVPRVLEAVLQLCDGGTAATTELTRFSEWIQKRLESFAEQTTGLLGALEAKTDKPSTSASAASLLEEFFQHRFPLEAVAMAAALRRLSGLRNSHQLADSALDQHQEQQQQQQLATRVLHLLATSVMKGLDASDAENGKFNELLATSAGMLLRALLPLDRRVRAAPASSQSSETATEGLYLERNNEAPAVAEAVADLPVAESLLKKIHCRNLPLPPSYALTLLENAARAALGGLSLLKDKEESLSPNDALTAEAVAAERVVSAAVDAVSSLRDELNQTTKRSGPRTTVGIPSLGRSLAVLSFLRNRLLLRLNCLQQMKEPTRIGALQQSVASVEAAIQTLRDALRSEGVFSVGEEGVAKGAAEKAALAASAASSTKAELHQLFLSFSSPKLPAEAEEEASAEAAISGTTATAAEELWNASARAFEALLKKALQSSFPLWTIPSVSTQTSGRNFAEEFFEATAKDPRVSSWFKVEKAKRLWQGSDDAEAKLGFAASLLDACCASEAEGRGKGKEEGGKEDAAEAKALKRGAVNSESASAAPVREGVRGDDALILEAARLWMAASLLAAESSPSLPSSALFNENNSPSSLSRRLSAQHLRLRCLRRLRELLETDLASGAELPRSKLARRKVPPWRNANALLFLFKAATALNAADLLQWQEMKREAECAFDVESRMQREIFRLLLPAFWNALRAESAKGVSPTALMALVAETLRLLRQSRASFDPLVFEMAKLVHAAAPPPTSPAAANANHRRRPSPAFENAGETSGVLNLLMLAADAANAQPRSPALSALASAILETRRLWRLRQKEEKNQESDGRGLGRPDRGLRLLRLAAAALAFPSSQPPPSVEAAGTEGRFLSDAAREEYLGMLAEVIEGLEPLLRKFDAALSKQRLPENFHSELEALKGGGIEVLGVLDAFNRSVSSALKGLQIDHQNEAFLDQGVSTDIQIDKVGQKPVCLRVWVDAKEKKAEQLADESRAFSRVVSCAPQEELKRLFSDDVSLETDLLIEVDGPTHLAWDAGEEAVGSDGMRFSCQTSYKHSLLEALGIPVISITSPSWMRLQNQQKQQSSLLERLQRAARSGSAKTIDSSTA